MIGEIRRTATRLEPIVPRLRVRTGTLAGNRPNVVGSTEVHPLAGTPIQTDIGAFFGCKATGGLHLAATAQQALNRLHFRGRNPMTERRRRVLHVLPVDAHRGAQRYARLLADALDSPGEQHMVMTLFASNPGLARPDLCLELPGRRSAHPAVLGRQLRTVRAAVRRCQPTVVVAHGSEPMRHLVMTVPRRIPIVLLRIGTNSRMGRTSRWSSGVLQRRARAVIGVSQEALDAAFELGRYRRPLDGVIHNGRSPDVYCPTAADAGGTEIRVLFVGALEPGKQPGLFVDAIARLRSAGLPVTGSMAGTGFLSGALLHQIRGGAVLIELLGAREDIPDLMRAHDLLAFTSLPVEGLPGVLIEAGLSGLPVVTTRVPGASEIVEDGQTGFIVDGDVEAVTSALARLVRDPEMRIRMGQAARRRCVDRFDLDKTLARWSELFGELAPRGTRPATRFHPPKPAIIAGKFGP